MELLERERHLADLAEWLDAAAGQSGCVALVAGEAGIGKTSLIQEFARQQRRAPRVLWGACDALFTPRPLAPLHDIARQTGGTLLAAFESGASREAIFTAAIDELERKNTPTLAVFEDMHWADEATHDLLKFLGRRIHRTRAMLVLTYRDDEVGARHPLRFVIGDLPRPATRRMALLPLSEAAVANLATQAGKPSRDLHHVTGGNPLFVTEVLAADAGAVPPTVRDAVLTRAARLSPRAREIAELVSVVPAKTEAWLLEQAAAPDDASIESCLSIGMVRSSDGALAFRHELARHAFEDSLSPLRQISLHERVLSVLKQRQGIPPARLAHHANGARNASEVLRFAPIAAAHAVSVGAHRQAAAHYEVALRYAENLPAEDRAKLHEQLAYECYLTDQADRAVEARTVALEIWRSLGERLKEGDNLRWLSRLTWFAGHRAEADRYGVEAVEVLEGLAPGPELAMAYSNRAQLAMLAQEPHAAIEWAQRTITLAETLHNNEILSHALNNLGTSRLILLEEEGWADLNRSLQLALAGGFQEHVARAYTNLSYRAFEQRRFAEATRYLSAGIAYCEEHDLDSWRLYMLAGSARSKFDQGDWNTASEEAEAVLRHPRTAAISRIPALIVLGHVRVLRGDPDAESPLEEARALAGRTEEVQRICPLAAALAEAAWHAGDTARVVREVQPAYDLVRELRDPWLEGEMAVWLKRADALTHPPNDPPEPYALELSGDYIGAARAWGELGCPYEQARMLASTVTEREQLEALATFDRMGATPAAQALRRQMRSQGVRGVPRGARTSTRSHPQGLTEREVEILGLLSDGLRNSAIAKRLFLSTRTVDHHVSSILTKLGVPSRAEAIAMARRRRDGGS